MRASNSLPATTPARLDHDGVSDGFARTHARLGIVDARRPVHVVWDFDGAVVEFHVRAAPRYGRNTRRLREYAGTHLVSERRHRPTRRSQEGDICVVECRGQGRVLRRVSPAWPDGVRADAPRGCDDEAHVRVVVDVRSAGHVDEEVCKSHVLCIHAEVLWRCHGDERDGTIVPEHLVAVRSYGSYELDCAESVVCDEHGSYGPIAVVFVYESLERVEYVRRPSRRRRRSLRGRVGRRGSGSSVRRVCRRRRGHRGLLRRHGRRRFLLLLLGRCRHHGQIVLITTSQQRPRYCRCCDRFFNEIQPQKSEQE
mmetsp:Transcript_5828/g.15005  ORF Transcript_5828/g.15005 Transcript_5828/m.15005 type:complete len:311 (-) Transcript_5828:107-1039(-)